MENFEEKEADSKNEKWGEKILNQILSFDMYAEPLNLTYKKKSKFNTRYGVIFSILTVLIALIIILNCIVFYKPNNECSYKQIDDTVIDTYDIGIGSEFLLFFSVLNNQENKYVDVIQDNYFFPKIGAFSTKVSNYILNTTSSGVQYEFQPCSISLLDGKMNDHRYLCPNTNQLSLTNVNLLMTKLHFYLVDNSDISVKESRYKDLVLEIYTLKFTYDTSTETTKKGFIRNQINFKDFINGPNVYTASIEKERFITYSGWLNSITTKDFYQMSNIKQDIQTDRNNLMTVKINLPYYTKINLYQGFSIFNSIGIVSGWLFLTSVILKFIVGKCSRYKLYESIANDAFAMISPEGNERIEETIKYIKDQLSSEKSNLIDLVVDDAHKYVKNDQIKLNSLEMILYLFCCDWVKSKNTKMKEKTIKKAFEELFKTIDIVNVIKTCQEIRLLKEIIFEPYQKKLFENLIHTKVTTNEVNSVYDIEYLETKAKSEEEKDAMSKANLKDALIQLSSNEFYSDIDIKFINSLFINPEFKQIFFKINMKTEMVKQNYFNIFNNINLANRDKVIQNFENFIKQLVTSIGEYKQINNALIDETNEIMNNYNIMYEENKILKDVVYGDFIKKNGYIKNENLNSLTVTYHPIILPKEKSQEQLEFSRNLKIIRKRKGCFYQVERFINGYFHFINKVLCIRRKIDTLRTDYNIAIQHSFEANIICMRISFLSILVFLFFIVKSLLFNSTSSECKVWFLCMGFLSFHRKPSDISFNYSFSIIFYMIIMFIFTLNLLIKQYFTQSSNSYIDKTYNFSKALFSSPNFKILSEEDAQYQLNSLMCILTSVDKNINKKHFKSTMVNILIFIANVLIIFLSGYCSLLIWNLLKNTQIDYVVKVFLCSLIIATISNFTPKLNLFLIQYHINFLPSTINIFQFWIPLLSKYITYGVLIISNFRIFFKPDAKGDYDWEFNSEKFICREDQTAYNLIIFQLIELIVRKGFTILYCYINNKNRRPFSVEMSIVNTTCSMLLFSLVTLVYPYQALITFIIFFFDFHLEYFILRKFRSNPQSFNLDSVKYFIF